MLFRVAAPPLSPGKLRPNHAGNHSQNAEKCARIYKFNGFYIVFLVVAAEVFYAVEKGNKIHGDHPEPHRHMEIQVADAFVQDRFTRHIEQEAGYNGVNHQHNR